jgi:hypothetical protein
MAKNHTETRHTANLLIDEHQAAEILCLSVKTLRRWRFARRGPPWHRLGAAVRYSTADLQDYIAAGRQEPGKAA